MNAIVCDKCGKVMLLEDRTCFPYPAYRLLPPDRSGAVALDLCEECAEALVSEVRDKEEG